MPPSFDQRKINAQLNLLNQQDHSNNWIVADGYHALTTFMIEDGKSLFKPDKGIPIKVFANVVTGEIKIFDLRIFR